MHTVRSQQQEVRAAFLPEPRYIVHFATVLSSVDEEATVEATLEDINAPTDLIVFSPVASAARINLGSPNLIAFLLVVPATCINPVLPTDSDSEQQAAIPSLADNLVASADRLIPPASPPSPHNTSVVSPTPSLFSPLGTLPPWWNRILEPTER